MRDSSETAAMEKSVLAFDVVTVVGACIAQKEESLIRRVMLDRRTSTRRRCRPGVMRRSGDLAAAVTAEILKVAPMEFDLWCVAYTAGEELTPGLYHDIEERCIQHACMLLDIKQ